MNADAFEPARARQTKAKTSVKAPGAYDIPFLTVLMALVLLYAWSVRGERHLTAESGIGYYLGISGSVMMLLLLVYPLRKRFRALRWLGGVPSWFRVHMLLGVIGPSLVILHSNFRLGSLNSQVALFSMLFVAGSGFVGRFLYRRIHRGLSGRRRTAGELRERTAELWVALLGRTGDDQLGAKLKSFETLYLSEHRSLFAAIYRLVAAGRIRKALRREILKQGQGDPRLVRDVDAYLEATRRAQAFVVYERLFSLWHLLHLPLFIVLVGAALLHVLAVHLY